MNICFLCDLHLPATANALQYKVLDWSVLKLKELQPDCIVFAGDATADGNAATYEYFLGRMQSLRLPFLYIPGNSDLRSEQDREKLINQASPCKTSFGSINIFAINDCSGSICENQLSLLKEAKENDLVFMHHPINSLKEESKESMKLWRNHHPGAMLFYGHRHIFEQNGNDVCLQAMDPDKAIGECPCITYYNTETRELRRIYYDCPVPFDLHAQLGVSCFDEEREIEFAIEKGLVNLELRPNVLKKDEKTIVELIHKWRKAGGKNLSIHLTEVCYDGVNAYSDERYDKLVALAQLLKADRFTQHVPNVPLAVFEQDETAMPKICDFIATKLNKIEHPIVVGVENMHMTAKDVSPYERRFGYKPEEVLFFMNELKQKCRHKVGVNLDVGHARNNAPFSQKYQLSVWYAMLGKYAVGYHIHQVSPIDGKYKNHTAITDVYGRLISYASFFKCWELGEIAKAPVIFEMRTENAYEISLAAFAKHQK